MIDNQNSFTLIQLKVNYLQRKFKKQQVNEYLRNSLSYYIQNGIEFDSELHDAGSDSFNGTFYSVCIFINNSQTSTHEFIKALEKMKSGFNQFRPQNGQAKQFQLMLSDNGTYEDMKIKADGIQQNTNSSIYSRPNSQIKQNFSSINDKIFQTEQNSLITSRLHFPNDQQQSFTEFQIKKYGEMAECNNKTIIQNSEQLDFFSKASYVPQQSYQSENPSQKNQMYISMTDFEAFKNQQLKFNEEISKRVYELEENYSSKFENQEKQINDLRNDLNSLRQIKELEDSEKIVNQLNESKTKSEKIEQSEDKLEQILSEVKSNKEQMNQLIDNMRLLLRISSDKDTNKVRRMSVN